MRDGVDPALTIPALLATLLFAGCVAPESHVEPTLATGEFVHWALEGCPLTLPDGAPVDCFQPMWSEPTSTQPPAETSGWRCADQFDDDGTLFQVWSQVDGTVGVYFEGTSLKDGGVSFYQASVYTPDGGWVVLLRESPSAFIVLPPVPEGRADLYLSHRQVRLFADDGDGWRQPADARLVVDGYGGHAWLAWALAHRDGTLYLDVMRDDAPADELVQWRAATRHMAGPDGMSFIAEATGNGVKYVNARLPPHLFTSTHQCYT